MRKCHHRKKKTHFTVFGQKKVRYLKRETRKARARWKQSNFWHLYPDG
jgi:hypothetical protein